MLTYITGIKHNLLTAVLMPLILEVSLESLHATLDNPVAFRMPLHKGLRMTSCPQRLKSVGNLHVSCI